MLELLLSYYVFIVVVNIVVTATAVKSGSALMLYRKTTRIARECMSGVTATTQIVGGVSGVLCISADNMTNNEVAIKTGGAFYRRSTHQIYLMESLRSILTDRQLAAVMAHEQGHYNNRDSVYGQNILSLMNMELRADRAALKSVRAMDLIVALLKVTINNASIVIKGYHSLAIKGYMIGTMCDSFVITMMPRLVQLLGYHMIGR